MSANAHQSSNVSSDLIWELSRKNNSFLVKRKTGGGAQFSRDPLNLVNKHSRKYSGFANDKAVGIQPGATGGIVLRTKKTKHLNRPAANRNEVALSGQKSGPKIYKTIATHVAKNGYRSDLRQEAIARASAIRRSQAPKRETPKTKLRGAKARKAAEKEV